MVLLLRNIMKYAVSSLKKIEACGQLPMVNLALLSDELHPDANATEKQKDQCLHTHLLENFDEKL